MRTIRKRSPPSALTQWRQPRIVAQPPSGMECTYDEMRRSPAVLAEVEDGLIEEQGGICAYTGLRISITLDDRQRNVDFHIEHLKPQTHCPYGQDAEYSNMVACWPRPNCGFEPKFGARKKDQWPSPQEEVMFVSPLRPDCSSRFVFNYRGKISAAIDNDHAANETIRRLGLDHDDLIALRRQYIWGALHPKGRQLQLNDARRLLEDIDRTSDALDRGVNVKLRPVCFAIRQALVHEINKLQGIVNSRRNHGNL